MQDEFFYASNKLKVWGFIQMNRERSIKLALVLATNDLSLLNSSAFVRMMVGRVVPAPSCETYRCQDNGFLNN